MARPLKDRRNNWNSQWLPYMRRIATDVLHQFPYRIGNITEDDLVNEAWIQTARRTDPNKPCRLMGGWVRRAMWHYVVRDVDHRAVGIDELDYEPIATPDYQDLDGLLDAAGLLARPGDIAGMVGRKAAGYSCREIGLNYGISGEKVRQLLGKFSNAIGCQESGIYAD